MPTWLRYPVREWFSIVCQLQIGVEDMLFVHIRLSKFLELLIRNGSRVPRISEILEDINLLVLNVGNGWVAGGCWDYY